METASGWKLVLGGAMPLSGPEREDRDVGIGIEGAVINLRVLCLEFLFECRFPRQSLRAGKKKQQRKSRSLGARDDGQVQGKNVREVPLPLRGFGMTCSIMTKTVGFRRPGYEISSGRRFKYDGVSGRSPKERERFFGRGRSKQRPYIVNGTILFWSGGRHAGRNVYATKDKDAGRMPALQGKGKMPA
jgi:hypothetical protein